MVAARPSIALVATGLVVLAFSGCVSPPSDPGAEKRIATAETTVELGGVEGIVVDPSYSPLVGATVTIRELETATQALEDGSFAFSKVTPGTYAFVAVYEGYASSVKTLSVSGAKIEKLEFMLDPLGTTAPFIDKMEFAGFQECAASWGYKVSTPGGEVPNPPIRGVSACSVGNIVSQDILEQGNVTNDHFMDRFFIGKDVKSIVVELVWDQSGVTGRGASVIVEPDLISNDPRTEYGRADGKSPLRVEIDVARMLEVDDNMTKVCAGEYPPDDIIAPEEYCSREGDGNEGRNITMKGGALQWRVFPWWAGSPDEKAGASASIQQRFSVYVSVFYHEPAPSGYSISRR
ncbi:MAG: carboxypeptidase regulatory-like domain-containing protein [Euryarchaeota archaeon]|nr:carboxypeptidase regulatory-like domain-containing protein [Euryarchaeota archaeon]